MTNSSKNKKTPPGISPQLYREFVDSMGEDQLASHIQSLKNEYHKLLRTQILEEGRIDILAEDILGYKLEWFHRGIIEAQNECEPGGISLVLGFRGSGKSTIGTICRCIYEVLCNPNTRILVVSKTQLQAEIFLRDVKTHFESNELLREVFGDFVGSKWDSREIIVSKRDKVIRESTISCIGVGGPTASRHYERIFLDDIVNEDNARTELQREKLLIWYNKSLLPTLEPMGKIFVAGTRWSPEDLYRFLEKNETRLKRYIIPAILDDGCSAWPDKFPLEDLLIIKRRDFIAFESQFQQKTDIMVGKIFSYENMSFYESLPKDLLMFQFADLAISQKNYADFFAHCTIGLDMNTRKKYVVDIYKGRLNFNEQTDFIAKAFYRYDAIKVGIESNAYQLAQVQNLTARYPDVRVLPTYATKDKVNRCMKLASKVHFEQVLFKKDQTDLIEQMLVFPDGDHDDMVDALEGAVTLAEGGLRKTRENEPDIF